MSTSWTHLVLSVLLATFQAANSCPEMCIIQDTYIPTCNCSYRSLGTVPQTSNPVKRLNLQYNQLQSLESKVFKNAGYGAVVALELQSNRISAVAPDAFFGLTQVENINLAWNNIVTVTKDTFARLLTLESLELSNNPLTTITGSANVAPASLEYLGLENCDINRLEDIFRPPSEDDISWLATLIDVRAPGNNISCISDEMVNMMDRTEAFVIHTNPLRPDCVSLKFDNLSAATGLDLENWRQNAGA